MFKHAHIKLIVFACLVFGLGLSACGTVKSTTPTNVGAKIVNNFIGNYIDYNATIRQNSAKNLKNDVYPPVLRRITELSLRGNILDQHGGFTRKYITTRTKIININKTRIIYEITGKFELLRGVLPTITINKANLRIYLINIHKKWQVVNVVAPFLNVAY